MTRDECPMTRQIGFSLTPVCARATVACPDWCGAVVRAKKGRRSGGWGGGGWGNVGPGGGGAGGVGGGGCGVGRVRATCGRRLAAGGRVQLQPARLLLGGARSADGGELRAFRFGLPSVRPHTHPRWPVRAHVGADRGHPLPDGQLQDRWRLRDTYACTRTDPVRAGVPDDRPERIVRCGAALSPPAKGEQGGRDRGFKKRGFLCAVVAGCVSGWWWRGHPTGQPLY